MVPPHCLAGGSYYYLGAEGSHPTILLAKSRKEKGDSEKKIYSQDRIQKGKMPFSLGDNLRHRCLLRSRNRNWFCGKQ